MNVAVYAIKLGKDEYLGSARDKTTLASLLALAEHEKALGVSLHGEFDGETVSGEMSIEDARALLRRL